MFPKIFKYQPLKNAELKHAWNESFEIYFIYGDFEVTRDLLLLTVIFTSDDIYRFLTSARWRVSLPGDRVLQAQLAWEIPRVISAEFAHGWRNGMNKNCAALNSRRRRMSRSNADETRTRVRALNLFFFLRTFETREPHQLHRRGPTHVWRYFATRTWTR